MLDDLLAVQEHDSAIDRLRARRERLPERQALVERQRNLATVEAKVADVEGQRDDVSRDERHLDDNVTAIETRIKEVEEELYSGRTSNPRELQALQADIEMLRRQRSALEDQELDAMERREGLDHDVAQLDEELSAVRSDVAELTKAIAEQETQIDVHLAEEEEARAAAAATVSSSLLELYESIRARNGGIGAARLVSGTCQGCHLALSAVEVDRIKKLAADEVVRCDPCGAILVRS